MDILSLIQFDPKNWPFAVTMFLRIVTIFYFLPFFGEKVITARIRISLSIVLTFFLFPIVKDHLSQKDHLLQWNIFTLSIMTFREIFFGFAIGYSAKFLYYGALLAAQWIGINMGFQTASMFNPAMNEEESSFSTLKTWIVLIIFLSMNVHLIFVEQIIKSFYTIPIGASPDIQSISRSVILMMTDCFHFAIRLAGPIVLVQFLIQISLGLLNRFMPAFNVFVMSFPLSFLISFVVLIVGVSSYVNFLSSYGIYREIAWLQTFFRIFEEKGVH